MNITFSKMRWMLLTVCACWTAGASAQQLETRFSCSLSRDDNGLPSIYADAGEIRIDGERIEAFRWESSLFRRTHGFDCSIDESDGLEAEAPTDPKHPAWRIRLTDARGARTRRGYDFEHGLNCTIRLERDGDTLHIKPSCPALCGSRSNFSELSVELKAGACRYTE
jgi:hypothetical protein